MHIFSRDFRRRDLFLFFPTSPSAFSSPSMLFPFFFFLPYAVFFQLPWAFCCLITLTTPLAGRLALSVTFFFFFFPFIEILLEDSHPSPFQTSKLQDTRLHIFRSSSTALLVCPSMPFSFLFLISQSRNGFIFLVPFPLGFNPVRVDVPRFYAPHPHSFSLIPYSCLPLLFV